MTDHDTMPRTTFNPTSLAVYARHSRGLWQPSNGNTSSVFVITMSTRNNTNTTTALLAHCPSLADAHKNLDALAQRYGNATRLTHPDVGRYFTIVGERSTRTLWVVEVSHHRALKNTDLDDVDCGVGQDCVVDEQVEGAKSVSEDPGAHSRAGEE